MTILHKRITCIVLFTYSVFISLSLSLSLPPPPSFLPTLTQPMRSVTLLLKFLKVLLIRTFPNWRTPRSMQPWLSLRKPTRDLVWRREKTAQGRRERLQLVNYICFYFVTTAVSLYLSSEHDILTEKEWESLVRERLHVNDSVTCNAWSCMYMYMYVYAHTHMYMYMYIYTHVCTYTCTYHPCCNS